MGRKEGWGERCILRFYFTSHYPGLNLLALNLINISNLSLFCP